MTDIVKNAYDQMISAGINLKHSTAPTPPRKVRLGDGSYTGNIIDSTNPLAGAVYWHEMVDDGTQTIREKGFALLDNGLGYLYANSTSNDGADIWIYKPPLTDQNSDVYHVKNMDATSAAQQFGVKPLEKQAQDAAAQPALSQVSTLRFTLNSDLTITVGNPGEVYSYPAAGTLAETQFTTGTADCTTLKAALTASQHQAVMVCLDTATNTVVTVITAAVTASAALPARSELIASDFATFDLLTVPSYMPIGIAYLYYGQIGFDATLDRIGPEVRTAFPPAKAYLAIKDKWGATIAPTTSNDATQGYQIGSRWYDATGKREYVCMDATATAAVWKETTNTAQARSIRVVAAAGAVTVTATDDIVSVKKTVGAATTVNLPASPSTGLTLTIHDGKGDSATNNITITPAAGNINGAANLVLAMNYSSALITYDGTEWEAQVYGANTALSNLSNVAVNTSLISDTDNTDDLGSAAIRWKNTYSVNTLIDLAGQRIRNGSGATVNAGDVGYVEYDATYGLVFKTTTTAGFVSDWRAVVIGGTNGSDIYVTKSGPMTLNYTGTAPAAGDFLALSTTAGKVVVTTGMRASCVAIATAAGGGGIVTVKLLMGTTDFQPITNSENIWIVTSSSSTLWTGTVSGAPTATLVNVATVTGSVNTFTPVGTPLAKARLFNSTRGTYRLVASVAGTAVTTVSTVDAWAAGDTLTIESQTVVSGAANKYLDLDLKDSLPSPLPKLIRALDILMYTLDTAPSTTTNVSIHPLEVFAAIKAVRQAPQVSSIPNRIVGPIAVIDGAFSCSVLASGVGTGQCILRLAGYWLATE